MRDVTFRGGLLLTLGLILLVTSVASADELEYGSKVMAGDTDESRALSPFYMGPDLAYWDGGITGIFDPDDVVYINIDPTDSVVSEYDVRLTPFGEFPAGSQVSKADNDIGKKLTKFGMDRVPRAELRYLDVNGDWAYSLEDPIYLDVNPGRTNSNDVRITGYKGYPAGSRIADSDADNDFPTLTLPGKLSFFNANGNINNGGFAIYDGSDRVYMDTQDPFYVVTINDVRMAI